MFFATMNENSNEWVTDVQTCGRLASKLRSRLTVVDGSFLPPLSVTFSVPPFNTNIKTMTSALVAAALAATSLATFACAFTVLPTSSTASSTSSTTTTALNQELPFFAAPAFSSASTTTSSSSSSSQSSPSPPQSATVTLRLPLGTLFDGRDYIFVTESNVRGYEWTEKETDILLDDLMVSF